MKYRYFLFLASMLIGIGAVAQNTSKRSALSVTHQVATSYLDSLTSLRQRLDSVQRINDSLRTETTDGRYYRLFVPLTFYHSGAQRLLSLTPRTDDEIADAVDQAMMSLYLQRPDLVLNNETQLLKSGSLRTDVNQEIKSQVELV